MIFKRFPHIIQSETKDCGPVCLHLLCKYYGVYLDIQYLREICGMRKEGISVSNFIMAAEKIGFKASAFRVSYRKFRSDIPLPCIVHWYGNHFIIIYKITKKNIYVSDPIHGLLKYNFKDFARGWLHHTHTDVRYRKGICIVCEPMNLEINNDTIQAQWRPKFIPYILGYINSYKRQILQIAILSIAITFFMALVPLITQSVIDTGTTSSDYNFVFIMIICCIILSLSSSLGNWLNQYINANTTKKIKMSMMTFFINKLLKLPVSFFSNRLMGDIIQRSRDYERIEIFTSSCFSSIALSITQFTVFSIILYFYNITVLWIFILFSCAYIIWILFFWSIRKNMDLHIFSYIAQEQSLWIETLSNICDIKNFNYHIGIRWKWEKIQSKLFKTQLKFINIENIQNIGSNLINTLRDLSLIFFCTINVIDGDMTFGILVAIQFILGQLSIPVQAIVSIIINWQTAKISFKRIAEILTMKDEDIYQKSIYWHKENGGIKLNDLFFSYNINDTPIIRKVNCTFEQNNITCIIGSNGCGKSTLLKLISRNLIETAGAIICNERNINNIPLYEWRSNIGVITDESKLLNISIIDNILLGREFNETNWNKALDITGISKEIEKLPLSFSTKIKEGGKGLNTGLIHRILLARVIYGDPGYIFLDEICSGLDSNNIMGIINKLNDYKSNRIIVLVSHSKIIADRCDKIVVMKNGSIIESGTPEFLSKFGKEYNNVFNPNNI